MVSRGGRSTGLQFILRILKSKRFSMPLKGLPGEKDLRMFICKI